MKYFIRAVKYFFYFAFLTTAIVLVLVATGMASSDINELFEGGYNALWKMAIFFAIVGAVYPKLGFISRKMYIQKGKDEIRDAAVEYMSERSYGFESETPDSMTFRYRGTIGRLTRMYEDRIILTRTEDGYIMEGLRKDVMKLATGLEYRLNPRIED
jgi:hypothetical protein